jgi:MFS superfamily sulfate permease-like transporter
VGFVVAFDLRPTAAISIVLYASVSPLAVPATQDYVTLILLLTFLAGIFQWLLGLLRFGALVNFVSHSVVLGFTLGAAVVIAVGQLPNLLGLDLPSQATALTASSICSGISTRWTNRRSCWAWPPSWSARS